MKNCPYCAEEIQDEAIICRYCHSRLDQIKDQVPPPVTSRSKYPESSLLAENTKSKHGPSWITSILLGLLFGILSIIPRFGNLVEAANRVQAGEWNALAFRMISQDLTAHFITNSIIWTVIIAVITLLINWNKSRSEKTINVYPKDLISDSNDSKFTALSNREIHTEIEIQSDVDIEISHLSKLGMQALGCPRCLTLNSRFILECRVCSESLRNANQVTNPYYKRELNQDFISEIEGIIINRVSLFTKDQANTDDGIINQESSDLDIIETKFGRHAIECSACKTINSNFAKKCRQCSCNLNNSPKVLNPYFIE